MRAAQTNNYASESCLRALQQHTKHPDKLNSHPHMKNIYFLLITLITFNFGFGQTATELVLIGQENTALNESSSVGSISNVTAIGFKRGLGLGKPSGDTGSSFTANSWNSGSLSSAESNNDYIEWSVKADDDFRINISQFQMKVQTSAGGPRKFQIFYSSDDFATKTMINVETSIGPSGSRYPPVDVNQSGLGITSVYGGTIKFRLYGWGGDSALGVNRFYIQPYDFFEMYGIYNPGGVIIGSLDYIGLTFFEGTWQLPGGAPSSTTGDQSAYIASGSGFPNVYNIDQNIVLNNLIIDPNAVVEIAPEGNLTINTKLTIISDESSTGNLILNSSSTQYSSLIVDGEVIGNNVTYKRHVNINTAGNDLISAPVTGQSFDQFILNNDNIRNNNGTLFLFGPFEKAGGTYVNWTNAITTVLSAGTGYRAASTDNGTFTFVGDVNIGTVDQQIINGGTAYKEWNLIGNPYPSYIKLSDFLNASNSAQFETNTAGVYGYDGVASDGWEVWNSAYSDMNPDALIAPGQGFLVSSKIGNGTVSFTPTMRSTGTSDDFIPMRSSSSNKAHAKLKITNGKKSYNTDLYFNDQSTKALDPGYDAAVFGKKAPDFAIFSHLLENNSGLDMAVQSLPYADLSSDVAIPLGINVPAGQQITVSLGKTILPEGTEIYLEDNANKTFTLLNSADYTFTTNTNVKDTGRFFLRFTNRTLSTSESSDAHGLQVYTTKSNTVMIKGLLNHNTSATVYDIQGRVVKNTQLKANTNSNQLDLALFNSGVYIIKLKSNSQELTQKIILK